MRKPNITSSKLNALVPVILTMLAIRLYQIIDIRYANLFSKDVLVLYSIQVSFLVFAQFFGNAAMNVILVMWHQSSLTRWDLYKYTNRKLRKLNLVFVLIFSLVLPLIFEQFNLESLSIEKIWVYVYFLLSLLSTIWISKQILLDSVLISFKKQHIVFYLATGSLLINFFSDNGFLYLKNAGAMTDTQFLVLSSLVTFSTFFFSTRLAVKIAFSGDKDKLQNKTKSLLNFSPIQALWKFELGVGLSRSLPPFIFTYLCGYMTNPKDFLTIFFSASNLGFICTLPLIASLPLAIQSFTLSPEATENSTQKYHSWLYDVISFGLLPALCLLGGVTILSKDLFLSIFGLELDKSHLNFIYLYFCGLAIAAFGHILTVPIRAKGKSLFIVRSLLLAEISSNIFGMLLLIYLNLATPLWVGILGIVYSFVYVISNGVATLGLSPHRWHMNKNI